MMHWIAAIGFMIVPMIGFAQTATDEEQSFEAFIENAESIPCEGGGAGCMQWSLIGTSGTFDGERFSVMTTPLDTLGGGTPVYGEGDRVIVQTQMINGERHYILSDIIRRSTLLWLMVAFVLAVWLFGGLRAMRSFAGLAVSIGVLFLFILPRILAGNSPVLIALIGSVIIMTVTFAFSHGWNRKSIAALIGTLGSLVLTAVLSWICSIYGHLTGTASEEIFFLLPDYPSLDTTGILLAAIIIGTLGVLDDVTIAQSSAVFELRGANPKWNAKQLYKSAMRIGSDHIAAAINTLILAYAATSLPLLLLLVGVPSGESWWTFINREAIATEIIRTLVGSIGLLAAVPFTTWIASVMAMQANTSKMEYNHHRH